MSEKRVVVVFTLRGYDAEMIEEHGIEGFEKFLRQELWGDPVDELLEQESTLDDITIDEGDRFVGFEPVNR